MEPQEEGVRYEETWYELPVNDRLQLTALSVFGIDYDETDTDQRKRLRHIDVSKVAQKMGMKNIQAVPLVTVQGVSHIFYHKDFWELQLGDQQMVRQWLLKSSLRHPSNCDDILEQMGSNWLTSQPLNKLQALKKLPNIALSKKFYGARYLELSDFECSAIDNLKKAIEERLAVMAPEPPKEAVKVTIKQEPGCEDNDICSNSVSAIEIKIEPMSPEPPVVNETEQIDLERPTSALSRRDENFMLESIQAMEVEPDKEPQDQQSEDAALEETPEESGVMSQQEMGQIGVSESTGEAPKLPSEHNETTQDLGSTETAAEEPEQEHTSVGVAAEPETLPDGSIASTDADTAADLQTPKVKRRGKRGRGLKAKKAKANPVKTSAEERKKVADDQTSVEAPGGNQSLNEATDGVPTATSKTEEASSVRPPSLVLRSTRKRPAGSTRAAATNCPPEELAGAQYGTVGESSEGPSLVQITVDQVDASTNLDKSEGSDSASSRLSRQSSKAPGKITKRRKTSPIKAPDPDKEDEEVVPNKLKLGFDFCSNLEQIPVLPKTSRPQARKESEKVFLTLKETLVDLLRLQAGDLRIDPLQVNLHNAIELANKISVIRPDLKDILKYTKDEMCADHVIEEIDMVRRRAKLLLALYEYRAILIRTEKKTPSHSLRIKIQEVETILDNGYLNTIIGSKHLQSGIRELFDEEAKLAFGFNFDELTEVKQETIYRRFQLCKHTLHTSLAELSFLLYHRGPSKLSRHALSSLVILRDLICRTTYFEQADVATAILDLGGCKYAPLRDKYAALIRLTPEEVHRELKIVEPYLDFEEVVNLRLSIFGGVLWDRLAHMARLKKFKLKAGIYQSELYTFNGDVAQLKALKRDLNRKNHLMKLVQEVTCEQMKPTSVDMPPAEEPKEQPPVPEKQVKSLLEELSQLKKEKDDLVKMLQQKCIDEMEESGVEEVVPQDAEPPGGETAPPCSFKEEPAEPTEESPAPDHPVHSTVPDVAESPKITENLTENTTLQSKGPSRRCSADSESKVTSTESPKEAPEPENASMELNLSGNRELSEGECSSSEDEIEIPLPTPQKIKRKRKILVKTKAARQIKLRKVELPKGQEGPGDIHGELHKLANILARKRLDSAADILLSKKYDELTPIEKERVEAFSKTFDFSEERMSKAALELTQAAKNREENCLLRPGPLPHPSPAISDSNSPQPLPPGEEPSLPKKPTKPTNKSSKEVCSSTGPRKQVPPTPKKDLPEETIVVTVKNTENAAIKKKPKKKNVKKTFEVVQALVQEAPVQEAPVQEATVSEATQENSQPLEQEMSRTRHCDRCNKPGHTASHCLVKTCFGIPKTSLVPCSADSPGAMLTSCKTFVRMRQHDEVEQVQLPPAEPQPCLTPEPGQTPETKTPATPIQDEMDISDPNSPVSGIPLPPVTLPPIPTTPLPVTPPPPPPADVECIDETVSSQVFEALYEIKEKPLVLKAEKGEDAAAVNKLKVTILSEFFKQKGAERTWSKITLIDCDDFSKEFLLNTVLDTVARGTGDLAPVLFHRAGSNAVFFAKGSSKAICTLLSKNLTLEVPLKSLKLKLEIEIATNDARLIPFNVDSLVFNTVENLFRQDRTVLDLSSFHRHPDLAANCYYSLNFLLHLKNVMQFARILAKDKISRIILDGNGLLDLTVLMTILESQQKVTKISLKSNKLTKRRFLQCGACPKFKQIKELHLNGNPLCSDFDSGKDYISFVTEVFPNLVYLDGVKLDGQDDADGVQIYSCDPKAAPFVESFLTHYFSIFDSERRDLLAGMYQREALFSLTCGSWGNQTSPHPSYFQDSRNLKKVVDYSKLSNKLLVGQRQIIEYLKRFPETEHIGSSFKADLLIHADNYTKFSVTGMFREGTAMRRFCRVFTLVPENGVFSICNELLFVATTVDDGQPVDKTRSVGAKKLDLYLNTKSSTGGVTEAEKVPMVAVFCKLTGIKEDWARKCLADMEWDQRNALILFQQLYESRKIPSEAFESQIGDGS